MLYLSGAALSEEDKQRGEEELKSLCLRCKNFTIYVSDDGQYLNTHLKETTAIMKASQAGKCILT
ncbi:hypothetical protein DB41_FR00010 [Neochlamydia sp. TUME1]|nr:hypothetical protein DB41_FR00010 [Neochlamydia sp. TUME1]